MCLDGRFLLTFAASRLMGRSAQSRSLIHTSCPRSPCHRDLAGALPGSGQVCPGSFLERFRTRRGWRLADQEPVGPGARRATIVASSFTSSRMLKIRAS